MITCTTFAALQNVKKRQNKKKMNSNLTEIPTQNATIYIYIYTHIEAHIVNRMSALMCVCVCETVASTRRARKWFSF